MPRSHALLLTLSALVSLPMAAALAAPGSVAVPADSFINQHVDSIPQLTQQVTMDPVVRRRLARHFHTSGPAIVHYIQDNLVLKRVTVARRCEVYCLAADGHEYLINSRLAVGTPIFVLRGTSTPVLKLACGNPMVADLPPGQPKLMPSSQLATLPPPPVPSIASTLSPNTPYVMASANTPDVLVMPVATKISPTIQLARISGGKTPLGFLAGLPVLYGILHGGSNGNNSGTPGTNSGPGTNTGVTPVPEPSGSAAFLVGGAALAILLVGAKRRNRKAKA